MSVDDLIGRIEKEKAQETISPAPSVPMSGVDSLIDRVSAEKALDDQIARDKVLAAGGNPLEAVRDVGGGILSSFARLPEDLSNIARTVTGDADWARSMSETTGGWSEAARQKLLSETALAQQRIIARALQDPNVDVADLMKIVAENKQGAAAQGSESVGSFLIPTGAAVGSVKGLNAAVKAVNAAKTLTAAQKAKIGTGVVTVTNALMNAADTFTNDEIENLPLDRRYQGAALSGLASLAAGKLLDGGAEGAVTRAILGSGGGKAGSSAAANFVRGAVKGGAKEFGQEGVEGGGNEGGVQLAQRRFDPNKLSKQSAYEGTLGALIGGPTGGITGLKTSPQESQADIKPAMDSLSDIVNRAVAEAEANKPVEEEIKKPDAKLPEVKDTTMGAAKDIGAAQTLPGSDQVVRLQNRDRSTPSSVNQMAKIAGNLDYGRLSPGRDFGNGAPVVSFGNVPEEQKGRTDYAAYNDGQRVPVQYAVVDASTILTSNDSSGNVISEYRTAGPDRMRAIAGNGRIAGVQLAYRNGKAEKYRQEMIEDAANFGVDPAVIERIPNPVLVRIMPSDQIRQDVGSASNTSSNLGLSIVEQANDDAANINFDVLEFDENGAPTEETVRKFVGQFDNAAAASMTDAAGHVNQQGMQRFHAALFKKAYGSDQLTSLYAETLDGEAKNILNGMASAAGNMFKLEGLGDLDIRPIVAEAAEMVVNARR